MLVDGHALADSNVRSLQERKIWPHAARDGDKIGRIPLAGVRHRDKPPVLRALDMVERPAEREMHAFLFEIGLHALRRLREERFGECLTAAVHKSAVHARLHEILHDLDAAPRRAKHETRAYLSTRERFLELHGIVHGAHGEYARQLCPLELRLYRRCASADENGVVLRLAPVRQTHRLRRGIKSRDRRVRMYDQVQLIFYFLQRAEREQGVIRDRSLDVICCQHRVVRAEIRV